ncbi:hypothetical protein TURU_008386 [Turdus rufiventris]|nr:hypothetical protein TURU_008386 [Turdus rufiventris]
MLVPCVPPDILHLQQCTLFPQPIETYECTVGKASGVNVTMCEWGHYAPECNLLGKLVAEHSGRMREAWYRAHFWGWESMDRYRFSPANAWRMGRSRFAPGGAGGRAISDRPSCPLCWGRTGLDRFRYSPAGARRSRIGLAFPV